LSLVTKEDTKSTDVKATESTKASKKATRTAIAAQKENQCDVSDKYPESIRQWCSLITKYANEKNISPDLIAALIWQESGGDKLSYSNSGAVGLMQIMSRDGIAATFMCANGPCFSSRPMIEELQDPEFNIRYGINMLAGLIERKGSIREALVAYGPMDVGYYYADKVLAIYEQYKK